MGHVLVVEQMGLALDEGDVELVECGLGLLAPGSDSALVARVQLGEAGVQFAAEEPAAAGE